jgi:diamine N-acetyltransferase
MVSIRVATLADYEALCNLLEQADVLHHDNLPNVFRATLRPVRTLEYMRSVLEDANARIFLAEDDGHAVGTIHIVVRDTPAISLLVPRSVGHVEDLVVDAASRRHGIGRKLMAAAEGWARDRGATDMELTVYEFNRDATAFYQELSYGTRHRRLTKPLAGPAGR